MPFAGLSASCFAHNGFFNPYLPPWLKDLGAWSDHTGERVRLLRVSAAIALLASGELWIDAGPWWIGAVLLLFTHTS